MPLDSSEVINCLNQIKLMENIDIDNFIRKSQPRRSTTTRPELSAQSRLKLKDQHPKSFVGTL